ncbi:DUF6825 family protein [Spirulina sp. 06S082]|uniref:DUF6825 family protein n=1 Tax=Spirulina sp. 06S082 TaxID=3110248 RepID=UPI002B21B527|nr:hypothetical protein [Spirulina sp. 06S082]MEA5467499.1 hypothetical protein [Spirulina sp. 06S082]
MSNPVTRAFFIGKAFAEILGEKVEDTLTNALSEFGKFDAEQREKFRQVAEETMARADREMAQTNRGGGDGGKTSNGASSGDLQETIDDLRAEIASLRSALNAHRNSPT